MEEALELANDRNMAWARASGAATVIWPIRWARHSGWARVDQLLSRLPGTSAFGGYKQSGIGRETHKMMLSITSKPSACW